jgi:hypothetical protein
METNRHWEHKDHLQYAAEIFYRAERLPDGEIEYAGKKIKNCGGSATIGRPAVIRVKVDVSIFYFLLVAIRIK